MRGMELLLYQVDAFTDTPFRGNPAAIVPLESWLPDDLMQAIAMENNLAETAFFVTNETVHLRWFTPTTEVDLCGHATLATAHVLWADLKIDLPELVFKTRSGELRVRRSDDLLSMVLPADDLKEIPTEEIPDALRAGLRQTPIHQCWRGRDDFYARLDSHETVRQLDPDFLEIAKLPSRGLVVTAPGEDVDFVSRGFFPQSGIPEDPVTGSAHTGLALIWQERLGKNTLTARQVSPRTGDLVCEISPDNRAITLHGKAVTYLHGKISVPRPHT